MENAGRASQPSDWAGLMSVVDAPCPGTSQPLAASWGKYLSSPSCVRLFGKTPEHTAGEADSVLALGLHLASRSLQRSRVVGGPRAMGQVRGWGGVGVSSRPDRETGRGRRLGFSPCATALLGGLTTHLSFGKFKNRLFIHPFLHGDLFS